MPSLTRGCRSHLMLAVYSIVVFPILVSTFLANKRLLAFAVDVEGSRGS